MAFNQDKEWIPCWWCGKTARDPHHAFGGRHRKASDRYGLVFMLCPECHTDGPNSVHRNPRGEIAIAIKQAAQEQFEQLYGDREMFRSIFENDYLE
jgi:hypothetical protein